MYSLDRCRLEARDIAQSASCQTFPHASLDGVAADGGLAQRISRVRLCLLSLGALQVLTASGAFAQETPSAIAQTQSTQAGSGVVAPVVPIKRPAADGSAGDPNEIVVTATRREQALQDVPIAVTALSGSQLANARVSSTASLAQQVPNLTIASEASGLVIYLRGVGQLAVNPGQEPSVATYVDGVYQPTVFGSLLTLSNIQRVEVVKGPQGTLFGRNATGGLINIVTKDPQQTPEMNMLLSYGNYQSVKASAYVAGGLANNVAAGLSLYYFDQNRGFGRNVFTGRELQGSKNADVRGKVLITPTDRTTITLNASYARNQSSTGNDLGIIPGQTAFGYASLPGFYDIQADTEPNNLQKTFQVSGKIKQDLTFADLVSITAFTRTTATESEDVDTTPLPILNFFGSQKAKVFTQELQLVSKTGSGFNWIVGAFYYHSDAFGTEPFGTSLRGIAFGCPLCGLNSRVSLRTESFAGYGEATYEILPKLEITGGFRYTSDRKKLGGLLDVVGTDGNVTATVPSPTGRATFNKPTYRAIASYHFTPEVMGYLSYSRGFKSGGFDTSIATGTAYNPEVLDAFEAGVKSTFFDHRLRLNVAGFHYAYKGLQLPILVPPATQITVNASNASVNGVDLDGVLRVNRLLNLNFGFGYLDTEYKSFEDAPCTRFDPATGTVVGFSCSVDGNRLLFSPKFSYSIGANLKVPSSIGDISLTASYSYRSKFFFDISNRLAQQGYGLLNGTLSLSPAGDRISVALFVENLTDKKYTLGQFVTAGFPDRYDAGPPRTFGVELRGKF